MTATWGGVLESGDELSGDQVRRIEDLVELLGGARERAGLTIRALARRADLPTSTVGGYLTGKHLPPASRPEVLFALLDALDVAVTDEESWRRMLWRLGQTRVKSGDEQAPYRGLLPFDEDSADHYFGRDDEVATLLDLVLGCHPSPDGEAPPVVVVVGASGTGKSSLVRAGLLPALDGGWAVATVQPGPSPHAAVSGALDGLSASTAPHRLLVLDQLEELWTLSGDAAPVLDLLRTAAVPGLVVVATLRADLYPEASRDPLLATGLRHRQVLLAPPAPEAIARSITGPAEAVGAALAPGLVERMVTDATSPSEAGRAAVSLPHLSHCLRQMWERRERNLLTHDLYEAVGGIEGALTSTAEEILAGLDEAGRAAVRSLLLRLVVVEQGLAPTCVSVPTASVVDPAQQQVVDLLARERLVVVDSERLRLSHEALLGGWPRMAAWVEEDRELLATRRMVEREATDWLAHDEDPGLLLRGGRLEAARDLEEPERLLAPEALAFVRAGVAADEEHRSRSAAEARRRLLLLRVVSVLAVLALVASAGLVWLSSRLGTERDEARSRQLAAQSIEVSRLDPVMGNQLALAAFATADTLESRSVLLDAASRPRTVNLAPGVGGLFLGAAPDAGLLAVGGEDPAVSLYDTTAAVPQLLAQVPAPLGGDGGALYAVALSPDGRWLAASGSAGVVGVWDLERPEQPRSLGEVEVEGGVNDIVFAGPDTTMYVGSTEGGIGRWRLGRVAEPLAALATSEQVGVVSAMTLLGADRLAVGTEPGEVSVWSLDAARTEPVARTRVAERQVTGIAVLGDHLAVSTRAARAYVVPWSAAEDALGEPEEVGEFGNWVNDAAGSADQGLTAFASSDKVVAVLDDQGVERERVPVSDNATSVVFVGPRRIAYGSVDGQAVVRDIPPYPGDGGIGSVYGTGWARDRPVAAVVALGLGEVKDVSIWDVEDPLVPQPLGRITSGPTDGRTWGAGDISPDGRTVVAGTDGGALLVWDVEDPSAPVERTGGRLEVGVPSLVRFVRDDLVMVSTEGGEVVLVSVPPAGDVVVTRRLVAGPTTLMLASSDADVSLVAAGGADGTTYLWRPDGGTDPVATIDGDGIVYAVALTSDGSRLAVSGTDRGVRVYDVSDPADPVLVDRMSGTTGTIFSLEYAPDDQRLLGVVNDGGVLSWQRDGDDHSLEDRVPRGLPLYVGSWSPDGQYVLAGGFQGHTRVVPTSTATAREHLCATVGEWLSARRWSASLGLEDVPDPCAAGA